MKAKQVLSLLKITRQTLCKYVANGKLKVTKLPSNLYDYDEKSVYDILYKNVTRKTVIYARVSTSKQKSDLNNQIELLKQYCFMNGYQISNIYSDIASGISFKDRKDFFSLLDEVMNNKVRKVIITYKDRMSRVGFELFSTLFNKFNCQIEVISEVGSQSLDSKEIFDEIVSLLHCYSMKLYSSRRQNKIKEICIPE